ncbi:hypothetical protein V7S43_008552 [Phytophthora oleae]|uniref:Uncharacterized protein n=1 Tax=Phytophthora oleae TaxID=2107226 RepID=A0ABD3FH94_9STRA
MTVTSCKTAHTRRIVFHPAEYTRVHGRPSCKNSCQRGCESQLPTVCNESTASNESKVAIIAICHEAEGIPPPQEKVFDSSKECQRCFHCHPLDLTLQNSNFGNDCEPFPTPTVGVIVAAKNARHVKFELHHPTGFAPRPGQLVRGGLGEVGRLPYARA